MSLLKFLLIFAVARMVGCASHLVPESVDASLRAYELGLLHKVATQGPGGFDNAVQSTVLDGPARYAGGVAKLLTESAVGTHDEEVGLFFAEYVSGEAAVVEALKVVAERHVDPGTKKFIEQVLADPNGAQWRVEHGSKKP